VLYVATARNVAAGIEKGEVHDRASLQNAGLGGEPLRTGPAFCCSLFQSIGEDDV
jgi:hypothetical protein